MAETTAKIKLIFDGVERGVVSAAAKSQAAIKALSRETSTASGYVGLFAVATGAGAAAVGAALPAIASLGLQFGVFKLAMKANNAESKAFKAQLDAMKKPIQDLENAAGKTFLPGVTKFLKDSTDLFPLLDHAVARTGKIMGDTASKMGDLFKTENFQQSLEDMLRSSDTITSAIGDSFVKLTGKIVEFGGNMAPAAEGFATFIRDAQAGISGFLDALAPHAADFKSIFESLGSIVRDLLPVIGQLAGALAGDLVPILRSVAGFIHDNQAAISALVPYIAAAALAFGSLKIILPVVGWIGQFTSALGGLAGKLGSADASLGGFSGKLGALKGAGGAAGVAVALLGVAAAIDQINVKAAGGAKNLDGIAVNLHQFVDTAKGILGGDIGFGQIVDQAKAAGMGIKNALSGFKLTPLKLDVDANGARAEADKLISEINGATPVVNINGNNTGAGFALREILSEIAAGKESVTIDGQPIPAQQALARVKSMIDTSSGNVTINGQTVPASRALDMILARVRGSRSDIQVGANTGGAQGVIDGFIRRNDGRQIRIFTSVLGSGGIASAGRLASGGPVSGPGSGTSDTAGLFALSNGEYVATARQVNAAGGPGAFGRLMQALERGPARMASGGAVSSARAAMRVPSTPSGSAAGGTVVQFAGNTSDALATVIMGMIRTGKIQIKAA